MPKNTKPIILCILDGWGVSADSAYNAISTTPTPNWHRLCEIGAYAELQASEHFVGLPHKQIGNSEVGHANIGCGRILKQDLPRIDDSIKGGEFVERVAKSLAKLGAKILPLREGVQTIHIIGLLSAGGVHSHQFHMQSLVESLQSLFAKDLSAKRLRIVVHAITDGRDTPPREAFSALKAFRAACPDVLIATICGRFYAMDRDHNWERTALAYNAMVKGQAKLRRDFAEDVVRDAYGDGGRDEFIVPSVLGTYDGMQDGDIVFFVNFRADRMRQLASAIVGLEKHEFCQNPPCLMGSIGLTEYSKELSQKLETLFPSESVQGTLGEVVSDAGYKQLRVAETEKYAHVTYFFNGNNEAEYAGEERILVPSKKVKSYDLMPEMSAYEVLEEVEQAVESGDYALIVVNFANADMVGHSGDMAAAKQAVAVLDKVLGRLAKSVDSAGGVLLITADHGNIEMMFDESIQERHTAHTTNPVPLVLLGAERFCLQDGSLCDIAPTIIGLMGLTQPSQMQGKSLLVKN